MMPRAVPLGDVATFIRGITFKPDDVLPLGAPGAVACFRTKNIQAELDLTDVWAVGGSLVKRDDQLLVEGDVLVSSANSWNLVGKCSWVPSLPWQSSFGGFVSVLRATSSEVDRRYLYWWFSSDRIQALLRSFGQKTTSISNLNIKRCLGLRLPMPPFDVQRRVAATLDACASLLATRKATISELDRLIGAVFFRMFGDPSSNPMKWPVADLGSVAEVQGGLQVSAARSSLPNEVPYLRVANVYRGRLDLGEVKTLRATEREIQRTTLQDRDLLVVEGHGNAAEIGRCAVWNGSIKGCVHQNHIIRARFRAEKVDPVFASALLNSAGGRRHLLRAGKTTSGLNTISVSDVKAVPLYLPPVENQRGDDHAEPRRNDRGERDRLRTRGRRPVGRHRRFGVRRSPGRSASTCR